MNDYPLLRYIALTGNILFILWIVHNGIDERAQSISPAQVVSLTSLLCLLVLNIFLLLRKK